MAAKEKQREESGSAPLADFVADYFELVYASQLLAQKRVAEFARAVQVSLLGCVVRRGAFPALA